MIKIKPWQWSTFGELLSSKMMEEVMKNPDQWDFDIKYNELEDENELTLIEFEDNLTTRGELKHYKES